MSVFRWTTRILDDITPSEMRQDMISRFEGFGAPLVSHESGQDEMGPYEKFVLLYGCQNCGSEDWITCVNGDLVYNLCLELGENKLRRYVDGSWRSQFAQYGETEILRSNRPHVIY